MVFSFTKDLKSFKNPFTENDLFSHYMRYQQYKTSVSHLRWSTYRKKLIYMKMTGSAWITFSKLKFHKRIRYRMKRNSWHSVQSLACRWTRPVSFKLNYSCATFLPHSSVISFKLSSNRRLASMFACKKGMFLPAWASKRQCSFSAFCAADYYSRCAPDA